MPGSRSGWRVFGLGLALVLADCAAVLAAPESSCQAVASGQRLVGRDFGVLLEELTPDPPGRGENRWRLRLFRTDGTAWSGQRLRLKPVMPEHGHGTVPAEFEAVEVEQGSYVVGPFTLMMPGHWSFRLTIAGPGPMRRSVNLEACIRS